MKILIFVAILVAVFGQKAVNVQADVIECEFLDQRYDSVEGDLYACKIQSIQQDENQNVITGNHKTGKSDSDVIWINYVSRPDSINLTNFDSIFCEKFPNLEKIHFNNLKPANLTENALHGCQLLYSFHLKHADIKQIPENFFSNSSNLKYLYLTHNRLETLPQNIFQSLTNLNVLWLNDNNLSTLNLAWFENLRNLGTLGLDSNKIKELPTDIFVGLEKLVDLHLQYNNLVTVHADSFGTKSQLQFAFLSHNKITSIDEKFIDNTVVDWLFMDSNSCSQEIIFSRNKMKQNLQKCFKNYQSRQDSTTTIEPTTTNLLTILHNGLNKEEYCALITSAAAPLVCGVAKIGQGNVTGGDYIQPHTYPWIAAVTKVDGNYLCDGVIVSNRKVVTAAHCMRGKQVIKPRLFSDILLLLGAHNLKQLYQVGRKAFSVQKIHIHPEWSISTKDNDADIAVLVLEQKIIFDDFIKPICLIKDQQSQIMSIDTGIVVGYGKSEDKSKTKTNIPKAITMKITFNGDFVNANNPVYMLSNERTIYGAPGNKPGTYLGDSASGLFVQYNDVLYLRGIVSSSPPEGPCDCDVNKYSIFTNITDYHDWIDGISVD